MLSKKTISFLSNLKDNNSKEWLDANRKTYEDAKNDILKLTAELINSFKDIDVSIFNGYLDPKKCITRLNRDLRFSKDKTPYKTDYYIVLNKNGKNSSSAFYFVHIEPKNSFVGAGVYNPQPEELRKIRQEIDYVFKDWKAIVDNKTFKKTFPSGINNSGVASRMPKGFDEASPGSEFLKMKGFYTMEPLTDTEITKEETLKKILNCFKEGKPLVDFLNRAIENE